MRLPSRIPHGAPVPDLTDAFNLLVDYVRSITPRTSSTVAVSTLSNGTTFAVRPRGPGGTSAAAPRRDNLQFTVSAVPASESAGHLRISILGGTAQAMFGTITSIPSADAEVTVGEGQRAYVCLVYRISGESGYIHAFDPDPLVTAGDAPPENTPATAHFPVAVVERDGTVLQGHTGAVFIGAPYNIVDVEDN